ncbi:hypothetical protein CR513_07149, partial [Mucuna pruriens]
MVTPLGIHALSASRALVNWMAYRITFFAIVAYPKVDVIIALDCLRAKGRGIELVTITQLERDLTRDIHTLGFTLACGRYPEKILSFGGLIIEGRGCHKSHVVGDNKTITHPLGIKEDGLVKVGEFIFPTNFVILDMEEDDEVLTILGRPFLAMGRAVVDVEWYGPYIVTKVLPYGVVNVTKGDDITFGENKHQVNIERDSSRPSPSLPMKASTLDLH